MPVESTRAPAPEVELDDVTTIRGDTPVLYRLRLVVPASKLTVLMGPSGVGKTTLTKHVVGLLEPDGGTVRIGGTDIWDCSEDELARIRTGIGAMLGGHTLYTTSVFSSMTVLDNLTYGLREHRVPAAERRERAMARLRELDLVELADELPERLPAHATKRLALARALVLDAPLTVLDEVDVGLDRDHSRAVLDAVGDLRERTGGTLLVTTHTLGLARALADNLAVLVNGRIVASGPPAEVLDGVRDVEDFDRRFAFSDHSRRPRLADALAAADRRRAARPARAEPVLSTAAPATSASVVDRRLVWFVVLTALVLIGLFVAVRLRSG
jgi:phospholipid/cholesterol/gamma-HCH transport system ATP-binding protein